MRVQLGPPLSLSQDDQLFWDFKEPNIQDRHPCGHQRSSQSQTSRKHPVLVCSQSSWRSPHVLIIQLNLVPIQYNESSLKSSIELDVNPTQLKYEFDQKFTWAWYQFIMERTGKPQTATESPHLSLAHLYNRGLLANFRYFQFHLGIQFHFHSPTH